MPTLHCVIFQLENFLFTGKEPDAEIKLIDFGFAQYVILKAAVMFYKWLLFMIPLRQASRST